MGWDGKGPDFTSYLQKDKMREKEMTFAVVTFIWCGLVE